MKYTIRYESELGVHAMFHMTLTIIADLFSSVTAAQCEMTDYHDVYSIKECYCTWVLDAPNDYFNIEQVISALKADRWIDKVSIIKNK